MNKTTFPRRFLVVTAALLTVTSLAGCTAVDDLLYSKTTTTSDSLDSLAGDAPTWIPGDATDITQVQTRDGAATSILLASDRDLDADLCTRVPRLSAPTIEVVGAPDVYGADGDAVFSCGEWTVMASADGWYGWTPSAEGEAQ
ncbi:hypothetical protein FHX48_002133 [Microbacterium halimionae]|uniref:Lipoprotein n=1 Tax=Microbacterium halimionae TaxID=1526413 RepID=A0A7W3JQA4_9MICO|nr:hypothetical protein [Microbacterium halimionae]MBA8817039.1 hypothetical protein [Microbacterium halimionae]NII94422.1 hypothetical protein [Microbacterium halimionae]